MKKLIIVLSVLIITAFVYSVSATPVLQTGVSVESIPKALFGTWQVKAQLEKTSDYSVFRVQTMDVWNLSKSGNVITLENPFSGAKAVVKVNQVEGNVIVFQRGGSVDNHVLTDTVTIRLNGNKFGGYNDLVYETLSLHDGHVLKRDTARYLLTGTKISGSSVLK